MKSLNWNRKNWKSSSNMIGRIQMFASCLILLLVIASCSKEPGACRTYASRLDFYPFSPGACLLPTPSEPPSLAFAALYQKKIIKNRLEVLKSDRLLEENVKQPELDSSLEIEEVVEEEIGVLSPASVEPKSVEVSYEIRAEYLQQNRNMILLLSDGNLFTYDQNTGDIQQVTQSGRNIIDFALSPSVNRLAILYTDPAVTANMEFDDYQSTYIGTELIIVDIGTGTILRKVSWDSLRRPYTRAE